VQAGLTKGQAGVWNPASWGNETVLYFPPAPDPPKSRNAWWMMPIWSAGRQRRASGPPRRAKTGSNSGNTGEFFGDASLEVPWRAEYKGSLEVALRASRGKFASGYLLRGESSDDKKSVKWSLLRDGKTLASASAPLVLTNNDGQSAVFKVVLQGRSVLISAGDQPVLSFLDTTLPSGRALAVRSQGFRVRADRLFAQNVNRDDYTFSGAPTDFYAPQGHWSIFSRWPCYGDWSFFGGAGLGPVLWSKRSYSGDIVAEMYAHPQMTLPKNPGYGHPGDLNITLCGDGKNPASGYSFVVAGWDNTRSKVMRGTQVLGENDGAEAYFRNTANTNTQWHRKWFYIRVEARRAQKDGVNGLQLTLNMDDKPIVTVFDPNPLPTWNNGNGRVAFWTLDSTLMIARAQIEAEKLGLKSLPSGLLDATPTRSAATPSASQPIPVAMGESDSALVTRAQDGWKITNPAAGGAFEVTLGSAPLNVTPQTRFELEAEIPAGVKIDAYCVIGGERYSIDITGEQKPDAMAPSLGKMTRSGSQWSFDLGAALQKRFPNRTFWKIDSLSLGARHGDAYRWVGFDGNALGASYRILNWKL
jgi:hypothetical protein